MEKIQEALAKARAAREAAPAAPSLALARPSVAEAPAAPATGVDDAWAALAGFEPDVKRLERARIMTLNGGKDASAFDVMRTKVLQTMRANNWRRLAITSPSPACGKSTIVLNLAFGLSRQRDLRSIVMELDLRRPSLAQILGRKPERSVAAVLEGTVGFADQAICYNGNLALSLCATSARNPAELLHGASIAARITAIEQAYAPDLMIFDMPPVLVSDDMMAFAGHVDCVLLVAAAEETTIKEIDTCERELASQTNFMGVVLNKCRYMGQEYGYSYYG